MNDDPIFIGMMETEKGKRIEQILTTDVTREQLAEALWCTESSLRMWHGCAEENRSLRLKAEAENAKLRELVRDALTTISWCTIDCCPSDNKKRELNERAHELGIEVGE